MPGTILVSVLELLGLPFPSPQSISIKISMGNKEYQTWDKGDFSFPLTTLRETLLVVVQDAEGNEISCGGIESKSIVERVLWDDIFPLEGGGQVHMKLQFVLSQDEKNRIRMMRESAIKRKQSGSIDLKTSTEEVAGNDGTKLSSPLYPKKTDKNEESSSSAIPSPQRVDTQLSSVHPQDSVATPSPQSVNTQRSKVRPHESVAKVEANSLPDEIPSKSLQSKQSLSSIRSSESGVSSSKKRPSLERSPSSVKRMISAFESNVPQDIRPQIKPRLEKQQVEKVGLESKETKTESSKTLQSTGKLKESGTTKVREKGIDISSNNRLKLVPKELDKEETKKPLEEFIKTPTVETPLASDKKSFENRQRSDNVVSSSKQDADGDSVFEESREEILPRSSRSSTSGRNSTDKFVAIDCREDITHDRFEISGAWLFPDQQRLFCVTTGGKKVMELMNGLEVNLESHQKNSDGTSNPKSEDVESSSGLFGQLVKVAIMVGFGVLVLFTRQRTNR